MNEPPRCGNQPEILHLTPAGPTPKPSTPLQTSPPTTVDLALDDTGGVDLRAIWGSIVKYKWLIAAVAVVTTVSVGFYSLHLPKVYEAKATVEFDPNPPRPLGKDIDTVATAGSDYWSNQGWLKTQYRIISSRQVAEGVVRELGLNEDPTFFGIPKARRGSWKGESVSDTAKMVQARVSVVPIENTNLVEVHVTDSKPERAALLANTVVRVYIEKVQRDRLGSTLNALDWLSTQLDKYTKELDEAELKLHDFKKDNNVLSVSLEDRLNLVAADLTKLSAALTQARMNKMQLEARLQAVKGILDADPLAANTSLTSDDAALQNLRQQYREAVSKRGELSAKYGEDHPQIKQLDAKIATLRDQIHHEVDALITGLQAELNEQEDLEKRLSGALEQTNQEGLELNLKEIEYNRLNRDRDNKAKLQSVLLERTAETNLTRMLQVQTARLLDSALSPHLAIKPNVRQDTAFGSIAGLILGLALAILLGYMDRTVKHEGDVEALGVAFLGIVPLIETESAAPDRRRRGRKHKRHVFGTRAPASVADELVAHHQPTSSVAECARVVRTNLTFMSAARPAKTLLVTSSSPKEGKTTIAVNLATVMAQTGRRVLLVDTDLRRPRLHRVFSVSAAQGITSCLVGELPLEEVVSKTEVPNLSLVPCGPIPPNPSELLHTEAFGRFVREASHRYDTVIFDSPPVGVVTDAAVIGPQVDGTVIVARMRETQKDMMRATVGQLGAVGANILGVVLNAVDLSNKQYGYRYYYYYRRGEYYAEDKKDEGNKHGAEAA